MVNRPGNYQNRTKSDQTGPNRTRTTLEKTKPKYGATSAVGTAAGVIAVSAGTTVAGWWILSTQQLVLQHASVHLFVSWAHLLWPTLIFGGPPCKPRARPVPSLPL